MSFYLMHRGWQENPIFSGESFSRRDAWVWLIEHAAFRETRIGVQGKTVAIERGQVCASLRQLAREWGWSEPRVRRFLLRAQSEEMIGCVADAGRTVITICNYNEYQADACVADAGTDAAATHRRRTTDALKKEGKEDSIPLSGDESNNAHTHEDGDPGLLDSQPDEVEQAVSAYNEVAERAGLPVAAKITPTRRAGIRRRLSDCGGLGGWRSALRKLESSSFCCGKTGWRADLDFLLQPKSFTKLVEGGYDDRAPTGGPTNAPGNHNQRPTFADQQARNRRAVFAAISDELGAERGAA